jgi:hypothetical protein
MDRYNQPKAPGYVVLVSTTGDVWDPEFDGTTHPTREEGEAALHAARSAGFTNAILAAGVRVDD